MSQSRLKSILVSVLGAALILGGGAVGALSLLAQPAIEVPEETALPVNTLRLEAASGYQETRRFAGQIAASRASAVGFERAGRLLDVLVDDGQRVLAGQLLARLDPTRLERERDELLAQQAGAEAELRLAELTRDRHRNLNQRGVASTQTLDETRLQADAAAARVQQLQAAIQRLDLELDKTLLHAPFDAVVVARLLDEGAVVAIGQPILRLLEETAPEARIGVPLGASGSLSPGQQFPLFINDQELLGTVRTVLPSVDPASRTVTVILSLPAGTRAPSGALVHLLLTSSVQSDGFWVPLAALSEGLRGLWTVYSVEPDGDALVTRRREVEILHVDTERAFVRGTLAPGLSLVADGVHRLVAGQRVVPAAGALVALSGD